jgi:cobalt-precorrin 5A hydrolase
LQATGTPSISETAALAAAGQHATLLGPRIAVGPVTCAIAVAGDIA